MNLEMKTANFIDLGITDYSETFKLQEQLAKKRAKEEISDTILISEHYPIVNFGKGPIIHNSFSDKFIEEMHEQGIEFTEENAIEYLKQRGISFSRTSRGGGATFIGQGQINFYPIVKYERIVKRLMGVDKYKELIDSVMYSVLRSYGLDVRINKKREERTKEDESTGKDIWIEKVHSERKPSISLTDTFGRNRRHIKLGGKGIHTSRGIAYHGFNFYVKRGSNGGFSYVNPCGYNDNELGTISLEEALDREVNIPDFKKRVLNEIKKRFGYESIKEGKL